MGSGRGARVCDATHRLKCSQKLPLNERDPGDIYTVQSTRTQTGWHVHDSYTTLRLG